MEITAEMVRDANRREQACRRRAERIVDQWQKGIICFDDLVMKVMQIAMANPSIAPTTFSVWLTEMVSSEDGE
jgi:hypothetical protein